jgi:predicted RNase H-like HicB family nuclease
MNEAIEFIAVVQKDGNGGFVSTFPDFPGCISFASTEDEVIDLAPEALAEQIEEMRQSGEAIPDPSTFSEVFADPKWKGTLIIRVRAGVRPTNRP